MIKAFENNTIGSGLAIAGGVFLLGILGLIAVWAMPPSTGLGDEDAVDDDTQVNVASLKEAEPLESYVVVSERPVFNEDRRPAPVIDDEAEFVEEEPEEYVGAPDVELAGIIITPDQKMVTLKSPDHQYSLVAFEGEPLEGDFGTWQVTEIRERSVVLASAEGEEMQLELQVHDAVIDAPPEPVRSTQSEGSDASEAVAANQELDQPMTRAEEIRQRIEERREELRRAAEASKEGQADDYRDAIQDIIQRTREDAAELKEAEEAEKEQQ